jgi:hypothetical protein
MVDVNPDVAQENYQFNPIERVTGLFDAHEPVAATVAALEAAGIASSDIEVFAGREGMRKLDASGDAHGTAGRLFRLVESWVSDTSHFHAQAAAHLASGGYLLAAHVGTDDDLKARVMDVLTAQGARDVKYWHTLFVEQGEQS